MLDVNPMPRIFIFVISGTFCVNMHNGNKLKNEKKCESLKHPKLFA